MAQEGFYLQWLKIKTTREECDPNNLRFVVFGTGQWHGHIMDWRGCNFWGKKLTKGVKPFTTIEAAMCWIKQQVEEGKLAEGMFVEGGYHLSDNRSLDREVAIVYFPYKEREYLGGKNKVLKEHGVTIKYQPIWKWLAPGIGG